jgi:exodeoxyribonuclease-3
VSLKPLSWNVNGIRAMPEQSGPLLPRFPHQFWNPAPRPGYSGTATFSRIAPLSVRRGMGSREHDNEGRVLTLELERLFVVNVYTPNSQRELGRLPYRVRWDRAFLRLGRRPDSI